MILVNMNLSVWWVDLHFMNSNFLFCLIKHVRQMSILYLALYVKYHSVALVCMTFDIV
jgi:hypothetical protein